MCRTYLLVNFTGYCKYSHSLKNAVVPRQLRRQSRLINYTEPKSKASPSHTHTHTQGRQAHSHIFII